MGFNVEGVVARLEAATRQGVTDAAHLVARYAVERAPIMTGDLRGSMSVDPPESGPRPTASIQFPLVYARRQHEETTWQHPRGGQAKYLTSAAEDYAGEVRRIIETSVKEGLG